MIVLKVEQGSPEWHTARAGVITGTRLKAVMGTKTAQETLLNELLAEQLVGTQEETYRTPDMQRGIDEEHFAIQEYKKQTGTEIKEFGFCLHDKYEWIGLSPDGFTEDLKHASEVKSPKSKTQVKYLRAKTVPKEYYWQVIQYFLVNEKLETLDFIIYDPRIKLESLQLFQIRVTRKNIEEDIKRAIEALLKFREYWQSEYNKLTF